MNFSDLLGKTIVSISGCSIDSDEVVITTDDGRKYRMWHDQDCCEYVRIVDVVGDVDDLIGRPITFAEEAQEDATSSPSVFGDVSSDDSGTWTFYKLATIKGFVDIRWLGESNGYYSERVNFDEI